MIDSSITEIQVRGYHLDVYQHVNNARYLELLEEARWQHYDKYPASFFQKRNWGFIIVNININYKFPAVVGDVLQIHTKVKHIGNTSMVFSQVIEIKGKDKVAVDADITFVVVDLKTQKPLPMEGELRSVLLREEVVE